MYKYVREVWTGLVLSIIFMVIIAVLAVIDPWGNNSPWVNWLAISAVVVLSVATVTVAAGVAGDSGDESVFWATPLLILVCWIIFAGMAVGFMTTSGDGLDHAYHSLAWTIFATPFVVLPLSAMVQYLVGAAAAHKQASSANLRRVA